MRISSEGRRWRVGRGRFRPLAGEHDYEWITACRQAAARQAIDAARALTEALTGQPVQQVAVLQTAIGHHPYEEPLYRDLIHAYTALGDPDGVRGSVRRLTRALAEIDTQPTPDTTALAERLLRGLPRRRPQPAPTTPAQDGDDR